MPVLGHPSDRYAGPLERMPHLMQRVIRLWQSRELSTWVDGLLLDSRDGERRGLPPEVADELLLVSDVNRVARAMRLADRMNIPYAEAARRQAREDLAARQDDALDDPLVSRDTLRQREGRAAPRAVVRGAMRHDEGAWRSILRLLGNPWVLALVALAIVAKTYWATLGPALKALWHATR